MSFAHIPLAPPTSAQGGPDLPVPPNGSLLPKATDLPTRLDHWWHTEHWTAMLRLRYISLIFLLLPFTLLSSGGMPAGYGALSAATLDSLLSLSSLFLAFLMLIMSMFVECDAKKALASWKPVQPIDVQDLLTASLLPPHAAEKVREWLSSGRIIRFQDEEKLWKIITAVSADNHPPEIVPLSARVGTFQTASAGTPTQDSVSVARGVRP